MDTQKGLITRFGEWWDEQQAHRHQASTTRPSSRLTTWLPSRGNVIFTLVMIGLLVLGQSVGALPLGRLSSAPAATSTGTIAYQGRLADSAGAPLTGTYNMIFRLYDAAASGTPLWEEQWIGPNGVCVSDGLFNVMLGSLTAMPQSVIAGRDQLFLGITVGTDDEMAPRVQLGSVPFAVQALTVPDGSVTTAKIADGAVTQAKLNVNLPRFVGQKSSDTQSVEPNVSAGQMIPIKGANSQDIVEITATTQGGTLLVVMTGRYSLSPASTTWCGILVRQGNQDYRFTHIDGIGSNTSGDFGCSGSLVVTLPAGTYTFRAVAWTGMGGNISWLAQRQIAVFEY